MNKNLSVKKNKIKENYAPINRKREGRAVKNNSG